MQTIAKNTLLIVHKGKFYPAKFQVIAKKEPPKPLERWYLKISLAFLSSRICLHVGVTKRQELSRYEQQKPRRKLLNGVLKLRQPSSASGLIWFHHWSHSGQIWVDEAHLLLFAWDDVCDTRVLSRFFARVFHCWRRFIIWAGRSCLCSWGLRWILALCCSLSAASRAVVMKFSFKLSSVTISSGL